MIIRKYKHVPVPGIIRFDVLDNDTSTNWNCVCPKGRNGAPRYVRVGGGGAIQTSETGADGSWETRTSGTDTTISYVEYDAFSGKYWAPAGTTGSGLGILLYSSDGVTWSTVSVSNSQMTCFATDGAGTYVATGRYSGSRRCPAGSDPTDPASWSSISAGSPNLTSVAYRNGVWYVVGFYNNSDQGGSISRSTDSTLWTQVVADVNESPLFSVVVLDSGAVLASGSGGTVWRSANGTSGYAKVTTGAPVSLRLFLANSRVYLVGGSGVCLESSDEGQTFAVGPEIGVTSFIRFGINDPSGDATRAIIVGEAGVTLAAQYGLRVKGYADDEARDNNDPIAQSPKFAYADQPVTGLTVDLL